MCAIRSPIAPVFPFSPSIHRTFGGTAQRALLAARSAPWPRRIPGRVGAGIDEAARSVLTLVPILASGPDSMGGDSKKRPETITTTVHRPGRPRAGRVDERGGHLGAGAGSGRGMRAGRRPEGGRGAVARRPRSCPRASVPRRPAARDRPGEPRGRRAMGRRYGGGGSVYRGSDRPLGCGRGVGSSPSRPSPGREAPRFTCASSPSTRAPTTGSRVNATGGWPGRGGKSSSRDATASPMGRTGSKRWRRERPPGFNDWRRLLGAVLLVAAGGPVEGASQFPW